eukprot:1240625-Rhodomonas_salina.5
MAIEFRHGLSPCLTARPQRRLEPTHTRWRIVTVVAHCNGMTGTDRPWPQNHHQRLSAMWDAMVTTSVAMGHRGGGWGVSFPEDDRDQADVQAAQSEGLSAAPRRPLQP